MHGQAKDLSKFITHGLSSESPLEYQTDYLTPTEQFFVCNSGSTPQIDAQKYSLRVWGDGVFEELILSYEQLLSMPQRTVPAIIECAGNHRLFFEQIDGTPIETPAGTEKLIWSTGAIGMAEWTGVPLVDVLKLAGIRAEAIQLCARGGETDSCEDEVRIPMPIEKAMDKDTLLAISMNGKPLPADHGFPIRVLVPGMQTTFVSAGEVLTVTSANGTYMELMREEIQEVFIVYNPQPNTVAGLLPTNLVIDIPGDIFPAFANVAAAPVQTLTVTTPNAEEPITPTTTFSWNASNTAGNVITISATSFINADPVTVSCATADDGEFTFPTATQTEKSNGFTSIVSSISRDAFVIDQYDDAAILVTTSSKAR